MRSNASPSGGVTTSAPGIGGQGWYLLGLLSLIWGSGFAIATIAVRDIPPATVVFLRVLLATALLYPLLRRQGISLPRGWGAWVPFLALGLLNTALPFTLNAWSLTRIESGVAGILTATVPIVTVVVAHFLTEDERATGSSVAGVAIGLAGVVVIIGLDPDSLTSGSTLGKLAILLSSLFYGVSAVYARSLRGTPPLLLAVGQVGASAVFLAPLVLVVDQPWRTATWTPEAIVAVVTLGTMGSALAYVIFYRLLTSSGATAASLVTYLIPVVAVILGVLFLDERLKPQHLAGMALIAAGMVVLDGRLVRWVGRRRALQPADT
jgi:drug/metabolite transporter (DMT)-like permease